VWVQELKESDSIVCAEPDICCDHRPHSQSVEVHVKGQLQKGLNVLANLGLLTAVAMFAFGPQGPFGGCVREYRTARAVRRTVEAKWKELVEAPRLGPREQGGTVGKAG